MIEFEHVDKYYESTKTRVFSDLSMKIAAGEFVMIRGESGSGKSTIIKMILKDEEPDSGRIYVRNRDVSVIKNSELPVYRRNFGVIFQDFRLIQDMSVYENIELARLAIGGNPRESSTKIGNVMKLLGITALRHRRPSQISGGQQQKVCLARAMINNPSILLADEPTANLDPDNTEDLLRILEIINAQGVTVVVATQDPILMACRSARHIELEGSVSEMDTSELFEPKPWEVPDEEEAVRHEEDTAADSP